MRVTVNVEQRHIDAGERAQCDKCPVALAVLDAIPEADKVHVEPPVIVVEMADNSVLSGVMTPAAESWVSCFDESDRDTYTPEPCSFELTLRDPDEEVPYLGEPGLGWDYF